MDTIAFIGGGNMASAIIGGLCRNARAAPSILVVDPGDAQRTKLEADFGVRTLAAADASLKDASLVVWAVKPQFFQSAAAPCVAHVAGALHLSVMAGIRSDAIARAAGTQRVVRAMPNTPALIGQGISGLYARDAVTATEKTRIEQVLAPTGQTLWATEMGLSGEQGKQLALATFAGATALAAASDEPPQVLRDRVTSKGGTTHAALTSLEADGVKAAFIKALRAAQQRARELGDEFGRA